MPSCNSCFFECLTNLTTAHAEDTKTVLGSKCVGSKRVYLHVARDTLLYCERVKTCQLVTVDTSV